MVFLCSLSRCVSSRILWKLSCPLQFCYCYTAWEPADLCIGTIQRMSACPCVNCVGMIQIRSAPASVDTHLRSVVKFCLSQFCDFVHLFLSSSEGFICTVVASCGRESLIVDQFDWQCCRSPLLQSCGVVVKSLVRCYEPGNCHRVFVV